MNDNWPDLPYSNWTDTRETLHRWLQIVGKVRLTKSRWVNHGWHSTLYVTPRGLSTSIIHEQERSFSIEFDFIDHILAINCSDGAQIAIPLLAESVASFHFRCFEALREVDIEVQIHEKPNEVLDAIPFLKDERHQAYDPELANRFWRALLQADRVLKDFRADFVGKVSPVHLFWGSLDLAVTRFSGRRAPVHPGGIPNLPDLITREAYSHEVSSCGFWPGNEQIPYPAFYSYAYPSPAGFESARIKPSQAFYHATLREFILPYNMVRSSSDPDGMLLEFLHSTYDAAADLGQWDRASLEESPFLRELQRTASPNIKKRAA